MPEQVAPYSNTQLYSKGNMALVNGSIWRYKGTSATTTGRSTIYRGEFIEADWENVGAQLARADIEAAMVEASCAGKYWRWNAGGTAVEYAAGTGGSGLSDGNYGDVTVSGTGTVITINSDTVTNAKSANMATQTIKGRNTAGTGDPEDLSATTVRTILNVANGATANDTNANLRDRATHTGTQSADTITDGTTNKVFLATERTKLSGIATSATANDTDANLRDRATHTGTQLASTISNFNAAALSAAPAETTTTEGALILGATAKTTPVDADFVGLMDSAASNILKKLSWLNIKATLKTYFDSLYPSGSGTSSGTNTGDETGAGIRTKLGTTTVGANINTLTNPSAVRWVRVNADNSVTARTAAETLSDIGAQAAGTYATGSGSASGTNTGDQLVFKTIAVTGQSNVVAANGSDTLTFKAGTNITITTDAVTKELTLNASGGGISDGDKGDVTVSSSGAVWTINNGKVTLAKMADMATASLIYRKTAGTGAPEVNTLATLKTDLGLTGTNSGDQTSVTGNAGTATALQNARQIGGVSFDGTADITPQNISPANEATDTTCFPAFFISATGNLQPKTNANLTFNSNTASLACTTFVGALSGNATTATNLSGTPALPNGTTATTQTAADNSTKLATTAYADTGLALKANLASPTLTGTPLAPTAAAGTNTTQIATTAYAMSAAPNSSYRTILDSSGSHTAARVAGTYAIGQGDPLAISGTGTLYPINVIYIDSADYPTVNGLAPKLRIRAQLFCNDVAPTGTYTFALHPITRPVTSGAAGLCIYVVGAAVAGSPATVISAPVVDSSNQVVGSDFTLPANGHYVIGMVQTGTVAASAHMHISASLQLRNA